MRGAAKCLRGLMAGALAALVLLLVGLPIGAKQKEPPTATPTVLASDGAQKRTVVLLTINGGINPATADYIRDGIDKAVAEAAEALVIQMDTPGGLLDSTKSIVKEILASPVPIVIYVSPSGAGAISAGVFVTMAAHIAAMAPGTNIGAAHPVGGQGEDIGDDMRVKVESFAASLSRTIAQHRGRNVEWAEKAVRESVSITEEEAVELKVVDLIASSLTDLLTRIDGRQVEVMGREVTLVTRDAQVTRHEMRLRQKLLDILANPNVAYLLMMAGILGLYVEFTNPGTIFPGVAGAICLLLAMAALQVLPINYSGLGLIGLGLALLVAELFVPSFGIMGVGGIIAFILGSLLLFDTPDSTLQLDRKVVLAAAGALGAFTFVVGWLVVGAQRRRTTTGLEGMIGLTGEVRRFDAARGRATVFVRGEYWDADAEETLAVGEEVEVVAAEGLRLQVRKRASRTETIDSRR